jgi:hypothetical protein
MKNVQWSPIKVGRGRRLRVRRRSGKEGRELMRFDIILAIVYSELSRVARINEVLGAYIWVETIERKDIFTKDVTTDGILCASSEHGRRSREEI